jgi:hypothetical protein
MYRLKYQASYSCFLSISLFSHLLASASSGLIYACTASPYVFDKPNLVLTAYETDSCGDFAEIMGILPDYCNSEEGFAMKYSSKSKKYSVWFNSDCSGDPIYSEKIPLGNCLTDDDDDYDDDDFDDDMPSPVEGSSYAEMGTTVDSTGAVSGSSGGSDDDDAACFVEDSMVQLKDGSSIPIQSVKVGDEILSLTYDGELVYSPVIAFPHALDNDLHAKVITLTTEESSMTVSRDHLLPVCSEDDCSSCDTSSLSPLSLVSAQNVQPNMCLRTAAASDSAWTKVTSASPHAAPVKGLYTVVPMAAYPVVDGIVASPFGTSHVLPSLYYSLHATCYRLGLLGVPAVKMGLDLMNQQMTALLSQSSVRQALSSNSL